MTRMATFYAGRRLSYDGFLCTVRYVGPLTGTNGEWLGIEWDDTTRGKHDGKYKGQQVFRCLSHAPTAASFVKSSRKSDPEQTVIQAIRSKYGSAGVTDSEIVIISGKVAEEVGFDKIAREQARLADLRIVLVDQMVINGIATRNASDSEIYEAQEDLRVTCPNVTELDLGWNTFESWLDIALVCAALPKLKVLRVGGSRFCSFAVGHASMAFSNITQLSMDTCLIRPGQLFELLHSDTRFASLQQLRLSDNDLTQTHTTTSIELPCLPKLSVLDLSNNRFQDLACLVPFTKAFPNVQSVSLQGNRIETVGKSSEELQDFPHIQTMNLSQNNILSFEMIDKLPRHFPSLKSLHITQNPFFTPDHATTLKDPKAGDKKYYLTVARLASLQVLNHARISTRDREEGEIYYLSVADEVIGKHIRSAKNRQEAVQQARDLFPRYEELAKKYNHDSLAEQYLSNKITDAEQNAQAVASPEYPAGSLGARIVTATFYMAGEPEKACVTLRFPSTVPVTRVMALLMQNPTFRGHLEPLRFRLIYESKELDPVDTTAESTTRSATYGRRLTLEQRKALWQEWGDWDADAMVQGLSRDEMQDHKSSAPESPHKHNRDEQWTDNGKICIKEGRRFKPREVEIPPALKRPWGDWLEGFREVRIRIEPLKRSKQST